jgi:nucleotide-binding universal stress UspA family protein
MFNFETILCPVDFSDQSMHALDYAVSFARHYNSSLILCHVVEIQVITPPVEPLIEVGSVLEDVTSTASDELKKLAVELKSRVSNIVPILAEGNPAEETMRIAKDHNASLIVMDTHGRSGLDRFLFGSTTENLIRKSPCPVLIVHASEREFINKASDEIKLGHILLGTDLTPGSDIAFDYALDIARQYAAKLTVVHVNQNSSDDAELSQYIARKLSGATDVQVKPIALTGKPHKELIKYATDIQVDLLVIGAHDLGLLKTLFGSEADKIIRAAPCPVLSVCEGAHHPE